MADGWIFWKSTCLSKLSVVQKFFEGEVQCHLYSSSRSVGLALHHVHFVSDSNTGRTWVTHSFLAAENFQQFLFIQVFNSNIAQFLMLLCIKEMVVCTVLYCPPVWLVLLVLLTKRMCHDISRNVLHVNYKSTDDMNKLHPQVYSYVKTDVLQDNLSIYFNHLQYWNCTENVNFISASMGYFTGDHCLLVSFKRQWSHESF